MPRIRKQMAARLLAADPGTKVIEFDLSALNKFMAYSEMTHILSNPAEYAGKVIRIAGTYYSLGKDAADRENYCSMYDGCCASCDVRFFPADTVREAAEYLTADQPVTVTGVLGTYEQFGRTRYGLFEAKIR